MGSGDRFQFRCHGFRARPGTREPRHPVASDPNRPEPLPRTSARPPPVPNTNGSGPALRALQPPSPPSIVPGPLRVRRRQGKARPGSPPPLPPGATARHRPPPTVPAAAGSPATGPRGAAGRRQRSTRRHLSRARRGSGGGIPGCRQGSPAGSESGIRRTPDPCPGRTEPPRTRGPMAPAPSGCGSRTAEPAQGRPCRTLPPRPRRAAGTVGGSRAPGTCRSAIRPPGPGNREPRAEIPRGCGEQGVE